MKFTAALIAGGRSSRFGSDKAFAMWRDQPLWRLQLGKLIGLQPAEVLVSCRAGQDFPLPAGVRRIHDAFEDRGPLAGLAACLDQTSQPRLLVLAVDMPAMNPDFLESLLEETSEACGAVPQWSNGRWEALAAVYPAASLASLAENCLRGEDWSLQHFVDEAQTRGLVNAAAIGGADQCCFANVNRPEDFGKV